MHHEPGAVETDALVLFHSPLIGFDALEPAFLAELETRSLLRGGQFLDLPFAKRVAVCVDGLDPSNPSIVVWEAAAAVAVRVVHGGGDPAATPPSTPPRDTR